MNKIAIISDSEPFICEKFIELGYKLIYTEEVDGFISYEKKHADMQCIKLKDKLVLLSCCKNLTQTLAKFGVKTVYTTRDFNEKYPNNVLLNAKILDKNVLGKTDFLDNTLLEYCKTHRLNLINVNQGYAACSCLKINDNSLITADPSISNALKNTDINVLRIREGYIKLSGAEENTFGFIGGASANLDDGSVLFFGDIREHPDYQKIAGFCNNNKIKIRFIENHPLTDIGSAVLLNI